MSGVVLMVGAGLFADIVSEELAAACTVIRQPDWTAGVPDAVDLALVLHDVWHPSAHRKSEEICQSHGIPWLRGFLAFGEACVGPLVRPGVPGCSDCADMRRLMAASDRKEMWEMQELKAVEGKISHDPWASRTGLLHAAHLLAAETEKILTSAETLLAGHEYLIHLKTLKTSRHFFLPDPFCPVCSRLPDDSAEAARIALRSSRKVNVNQFRSRSMDEFKPVLKKDYLDPRTGLLNGKRQDFDSPFAEVIVNLPLFDGDEATAGRTHVYADSELTGILEGLERYCGLTPRGRRTVVYDSYHHLADQALHPAKVGLHWPEQYARADFPFAPFDPDAPMRWVWGHSFLQNRPILVPESLAYYSLGGGEGNVYETSNGCALGGSLEEAIFYGILEVVERDAFLLTWYAQLPLPRLDPYSSADRELPLMIERMKATAGYDVHLFNATMENGIPSIWAIAKNDRQKGMNLICAAGAHVDPIKAAKNAVLELGGLMLPILQEKFEQNRQSYLYMLHDPYLVQHMEDHSMLYGLPEAERRLDFLLNGNRKLRTFAEEFVCKPAHADLADDLKELLHVFARLNLDVIAVNQTTPELRRNGLHCIKVLIPGLLPMTFGHHLTRIVGLDRVLQVPMALGYATEQLTFDQLNPHPHPFP